MDSAIAKAKAAADINRVVDSMMVTGGLMPGILKDQVGIGIWRRIPIMMRGGVRVPVHHVVDQWVEKVLEDDVVVDQWEVDHTVLPMDLIPLEHTHLPWG